MSDFLKGLQSISIHYPTPTPAAAVGAFDDIARAQLLIFTTQTLWRIYKMHMARPGAGLLVVLSYVADLRDLGSPVHLWRGLLEAGRQADRAQAYETTCMVALTTIRTEAIEACRRKP